LTPIEEGRSRRVIRFGSFEMDEAAGELFKDGARIRLPEQPFRILHVLLQQPGKVITREELCKRLWPSDTFVDFDHGINNAIKRLREAIGDTADSVLHRDAATAWISFHWETPIAGRSRPLVSGSASGGPVR
jgi:DNA-binding response OmpR family regulator